MLTNAEKFCDEMNASRVLHSRGWSPDKIRYVELDRESIVNRYGLLMQVSGKTDTYLEIVFGSDNSRAYQDLATQRWSTSKP